MATEPMTLGERMAAGARQVGREHKRRELLRERAESGSATRYELEELQKLEKTFADATREVERALKR